MIVFLILKYLKYFIELILNPAAFPFIISSTMGAQPEESILIMCFFTPVRTGICKTFEPEPCFTDGGYSHLGSVDGYISVGARQNSQYTKTARKVDEN